MPKKLFTRRNILTLGASTLAAQLIATRNYSRLNIKKPNLKSEFEKYQPISLKVLAAAKGLIYGAFPSLWYQHLVQQEQFKSKLIEECSLIVAGVYGGSISLKENYFDFTDVDRYAAFAAKHQMLLRGHPLIWHDFNAEWLVDKFKNSHTSSQEIENILINHVATIVKRYAGQIHSWDVVNEIINVTDGRPDGLRDTLVSGIGINQDKYPTWLHFLGADYIDLAFRTAAAADPQAILVYNENALEYDGEENDAKRNRVLEFLKRCQKLETPIHALGIQAHLSASSNKYFNRQKFAKFLREVASLGLKIMITELDVSDRDLPPDIKIRDRLVAEAYRNFLTVVLNEPAVIAVITWGLSDRYTWLSDYAPREDGLPVRPLPLDHELKRKQAWMAIAQSFE